MSSPITRLRTLTALSCPPRLFWIQMILLVGIAAVLFLPVLTRVTARSPGNVKATDIKREPLNLARLSESASVSAAARDNPTTNLSDGRALTAYTGPADLQQALTQNQAQPLSLASADFDEDGVSDLVSGYRLSTSGTLTLWRGNAERVKSSEGEEKAPPFLAEAKGFVMLVVPDFLGAGDFNADGHADIVAGQRGGNKLVWLAGDGQGSFQLAGQSDLPGGLTALVRR
jgi:hypothetical protein